MPSRSVEFELTTTDGVTLAGEEAGEGLPIVLLHGLTATRRYVVMGSRVLERSSHRAISYDARGHGRSGPGPTPDAYSYELLASDLRTALDELRVERAVLAGASMGAQTALRFALDHPERVAALGLITPAFDPNAPHGPDAYAGWDRLARGLREGGVEGFVAAYDLDSIPERWRETVMTVLRQRLSAHDHPLAVADALEAIPRSRPFESWADLERISAPAVVIASRDEADPSHPLAVGERYAASIPGARLVVEDSGNSPIAWQGGQLSKVIARLLDEGSAQ
ncbi:MAG TPA: alpha/beta hydrolase [Solirubrobacteraceae bacterium]|jgi:pimeloyl-ACP methyl ester carboxylesterase|nr:alpha/beta hydrolase [Solirubrobacteraceae bacterium]